jgi:hypothetical protein
MILFQGQLPQVLLSAIRESKEAQNLDNSMDMDMQMMEDNNLSGSDQGAEEVKINVKPADKVTFLLNYLYVSIFNNQLLQSQL